MLGQGRRSGVQLTGQGQEDRREVAGLQVAEDPVHPALGLQPAAGQGDGLRAPLRIAELQRGPGAGGGAHVPRGREGIGQERAIRVLLGPQVAGRIPCILGIQGSQALQADDHLAGGHGAHVAHRFPGAILALGPQEDARGALQGGGHGFGLRLRDRREGFGGRSGADHVFWFPLERDRRILAQGGDQEQPKCLATCIVVAPPASGAYIARSPMAHEKDPLSQSDEHNSRGIELADRGWLDEAIKEFKRAIELDPASAHAHDNLATVYAEKKLYREALETYLIALKLEPDSPTAHYNLGCFLSTSGADMAVVEFKEAIELDPEYPDAHVYLGLTYADQGKIEDALAELHTAVALDAEDAFARHELAALMMDEGDYRQAISQLKEVVKLEADNFDAWLDLGICYAQKGFYAEAERAYEKATALDADDLLLNYNLAALFALWGRKPEALAQLTRALAADRERVQGWLATDAMFDALKGDEAFEALVR